LKKISASLSEIELLHSPGDDSLTVVFHLHRKKSLQEGHFQEFAASLDPTINIILQKGKVLTSVRDRETPVVLSHHFDKSICGHPFNLSWGPACFSQVNARQNHNLLELVCRLYTNTKKDGWNLLDLYCGTGNFSVPLGLSGATITGIEQNSESITWAIHNAKTAGLDKFSFKTGDVTQELGKLDKSNVRFDTVLLDPPRQGLGKSTRFLAGLDPQNIFYISCDPATLMRDLTVLIERGYQLSTLAPVDMFPQTHHIETVAILEKN
jgi:23S rRNA (uracil1939-C5)-methyltransferase